MKSTTTTIRRAICIAGLVLTAAISTGPAGGAVDPSEQRAVDIRGRALNCKHARAQACMSNAEFRALMIRSEALNRRYGLGR